MFFRMDVDNQAALPAPIMIAHFRSSLFTVGLEDVPESKLPARETGSVFASSVRIAPVRPAWLTIEYFT